MSLRTRVLLIDDSPTSLVWQLVLLQEEQYDTLTANTTGEGVRIAKMERPDLVKGLVEKHGARDTTVRQSAMAELEAMAPRFSQWLPGEEVPEQHWMYRLAKKYWFNDFGAYAQADHAGVAKAKTQTLVAAGRA